MLEFLALLAVATVIVLGWLGGSRFVCVFLTLPAVFIGMATSETNHDVWVPVFFALGAIWVPYFWHRLPRGG